MGTQDGKLVALSATNGEQLWEFSLGAPVTAPPITYSASGRQYIAVSDRRRKDDDGFLELQYLKNVPLGGTLAVFGLFD